MSYHQPYQITGFHGCDKSIGLKVLNGEENLKLSTNKWDWLADGIYFWEQNPYRALDYAIDCANGAQVHKGKIKTPFVIGANIALGNCLNLVEPRAVEAVEKAYADLKLVYENLGQELPKNNNNVRLLDCAVIRMLHYSNNKLGNQKYDTVRCAFNEGDEIFPGSNFTKKGHIEVSVLNANNIMGYYLPRPIDTFNPYLKKDFTVI
jgi:hypothetical protein